MAHIALFHSVLGLRPPELLLAERLRRAGYEVVAPDLFGGRAAADLEQGFQLLERVGWEPVMRRARRALEGLPDDTILAGVSMGTGVVADVWPDRPAAAGVLLLHAAADVPVDARAGVRVQFHAADPDPFAPAERVESMVRTANEAGAVLEVYRYPGVGHFYTDPALPDYDAAAVELTWKRVLEFI